MAITLCHDQQEKEQQNQQRQTTAEWLKDPINFTTKKKTKTDK